MEYHGNSKFKIISAARSSYQSEQQEDPFEDKVNQINLKKETSIPSSFQPTSPLGGLTKVTKQQNLFLVELSDGLLAIHEQILQWNVESMGLLPPNY